MMVRVEADFSFCGLLQNIERFCVDSASSNTQIESKVLWGDGARARRGARALERALGRQLLRRRPLPVRKKRRSAGGACG